ncbi:ABC transporter substrate-binding protein [Caulobacter soli]|uniref:ABC transporter substrate-binding protein n=1 Tax=Caulobacter soli TaxID=2708539 RepID=UPI001FE7CAED|nr:ABC transporter substrate-binding protein [Caulobacter soli]
MTDAVTRRAAAVGLLLSGLGGAAQASVAARRVVSIGQCLDVVLTEVADRDQIAALSHFSRDPETSTIADLARTLPYTHESAEEVIALNPDLVIASRRSGLQTRTALKLMGVRVKEFGVPESVAASLKQVRDIAKLVGQPMRGEMVVARIERALAEAAPPPGHRPIKALVYEGKGLAAGHGTLVDEMMERCGFENVAGRYGLKKWGNVPLEMVLADPPEVLLAGEAFQGAPTWADRIIRHPALRRLEPNTFRAAFHQRLLYCGGPVLIQTAAALKKARQDTLAWQARRLSTIS